VRWFAPILSFTSEEIWQHLPGPRPQGSVFLSTWYEGLFPLGESGMNRAFWERVITVREAAGRAMEPLRAAGQIGSSLAAEAEVYADPELADTLSELGDELRFVLITSYARVHPLTEKPGDLKAETVPGVGRLAVRVRPSAHVKCVRCWHHREDVGTSPEHPELCARCVENVAGPGERRHYA
jgi:isoleucyl-tRNA synthetase